MTLTSTSSCPWPLLQQELESSVPAAAAPLLATPCCARCHVHHHLLLPSSGPRAARASSSTTISTPLHWAHGEFSAAESRKDRMREIKALYLYHSWPSWYQFVTSTFCHANWNHLSSNLFFLYIFGKLVEEEEGNFALWISYILTGAGANLVSWLVLPRAAVSVGASGAVFGLFAISVLVKMSWDWRKILEVLILGQFVIDKVMEAAQASTGLASPLVRGSSLQNVNHIAHLSGALIGVALVLLISRIPSHTADHDIKSLRGDKDTRK